jgi:hypothetical protein
MRIVGCLSSFAILLCLERIHISSSFSSTPIIHKSHARNMLSGSTLVRSSRRLQCQASSWSYSSSSSLCAKKRSNSNKTYRADRVLSNRGWGSRSECFDLLKQRRVFQKINSGMQRVQGPSEKLSMEVSKHLFLYTRSLQPAPLSY